MTTATLFDEARAEAPAVEPGELHIQLSVAQDRFRAFLMGPNNDWQNGANRVLYGGEAGGGKSDAFCRVGAMYALQFPGSKGLLIRKEEDPAVRTFLPRMRKFLPKEEAPYHVDSKEWRFQNGSIIRIGYLREEGDLDQYQSEEFEWIGIDEAVQIQPKLMSDLIDVRLRSANGYPCWVGYGTNPGGPAHEYLKELFIDEREPNTVYEEVLSYTDWATGKVYTDTIRSVFCPAKVTDNPFIEQSNPGYIARLNNIKDDILRRRMAEGDWSINSGQFFKKWSRKRHVVAAFPVPKSWRRWAGVDFGYFPDPTVICWLTQDPKSRRLYVYREVAQHELADQDLKALIRSREAGERVDVYYADTSGKAKQGSTQKSTWDVLREEPNGLPIEEATKHRVPGWRMLSGLLADLPDGLPALQVFDSCLGLISAIPALQHHERKEGDVADHKKWDHHADALRYAVLTRTYKTPLQEVDVDDLDADDLDAGSGDGETSLPWRQIRTLVS